MAYFKSDGKYIYLEKPYCEFYIPMSFFENVGFAEDQGQMIKVLGIFNIGFFENGELKETKVLNLPTFINVLVYDYEIRRVQLPGELEPIPCKVLKYFEGNSVMESVVIEDSSNAELYLKFVLQGKIPMSVPYDKSIILWRKNQKLNGMSLGVPSVIEELILSAAYRDKNNPALKFAYIVGRKPDTSMYDYKMASVRQICQYTSTFTAITFEDIDSMITASLNRGRDKIHEAQSPIEQIIKL
jgi:hypothetical protein